jgi:D-alanine-D-alanine ligase
MKKSIAIIAGGDSGEYEISIKSAEVVKSYLNEEKYNAFLIVIKGSDWYYIDENENRIDVNKHDFSLSLKEGFVKFDVVFNVIHGTPGENGIIQGYFDLLKIPYTSSDVATSSLTFNKSFCNKVVASFGINVASSVHLLKNKIYNIDEILEELNLPLFVKPNNGGSSVATTKVKEKSELKKAIDFAFTEDDEVLIEEFIPGREIDCGVFNFKGKMMAFPITEIVTRNEFFDYEAKYTLGVTDEITPADIPEEVDTECKAISVELYHRLNCKGVVRFDYIFNDKGIWFLEVNTVPGFSEQSIIPQQAQAFGISNSELFEMMIENI